MKTDKPSSSQSDLHHNGQTSPHVDGAEPTSAATGGANGKQSTDTNQSPTSPAGASQMAPGFTDNGEKVSAVASEESSYIIHTCKVCGKGGHLCKGCSAVAYCSKEHQRRDWPRHKTECKKTREAKS
jgi:hypothetical protein